MEENMNKAWMLIFAFATQLANAEEKAVMAIDGKSAAPIRAGELITVGADPRLVVDRNNVRYEIGPRSVGEFDADGGFRLLRGTVVSESNLERSLRTSGVRVDFVGKLLVSYDHKEKSSSAFVLEGQARMLNPHEESKTIRLDRFRGATMVVGEVYPQLVRQLDFASVDSWLKGYAWSEQRRSTLLKDIPRAGAIAAEAPKSEHLQAAKLEDYFSSIETADEFSQPDYYNRKFADPDQVIADANAKKSGNGRGMTPEEAALISLPSTKIDMGLELPLQVLSNEEKLGELRSLSRNAPTRSIASEKPAKKAAVKVQAKVERGDPEVNAVLERLRSIKGSNPLISTPLRGPASVSAPVVPDPVYDYSENF
jgi:hypothetical protein